MDIAIIASSEDSAGINVRNNLIRLYKFKKIDERFDDRHASDMRVSSSKASESELSHVDACENARVQITRTRSHVTEIFQCDKVGNNTIKLYLINQDLIFAENIDKEISADIFIFASKHVSRENKPSFTVHPIGNWDMADFGGKEKTLCFSSAFLLKNLYLSLVQNSHFSQKNANFEITLEATHHGPYIEKPALFVEIGSTEKEWIDVLNGEIIAKTIINGLMKEESNFISTTLLGGGHYNQGGNKIMLNTNYAIGHVCPKYALEYINEGMLIQAINKTIPKPNIVLLDWKGLSIHKQKIVGLLEKLGIKYERIQNIVH